MAQTSINLVSFSAPSEPNAHYYKFTCRCLYETPTSSFKGWLAGCARNKRSYDGFATTGMRYGDGTSSTEQRRHRQKKQRRRTAKNDDGEDLIAWLRGKWKPHRNLLHASPKPNVATSVPGSQRKVAGGDSCPLVLFRLITELPLI